MIAVRVKEISLAPGSDRAVEWGATFETREVKSGHRKVRSRLAGLR